jgi:dTDP-glucose pyrophosphorylase/serine/threonine protein kinase
MKIITVAAGSGTRLSTLSQINFGRIVPKPLYPVNGVAMAYWSYKSFNRWITLGIVKPSDFIFVVRSEHVKEFDIIEKIKSLTHQNVAFKVIDHLTSGPAETAYLALDEFQDSEPFIVNDCDHFFSATSMLEELNEGKFPNEFIRLSFVKPISTVPNWSYVKTGNKVSKKSFEVLQIVEKDPKFMYKDNGLIGAYFFSSVNLFKSLYIALLSDKSEKFVSKIVDLALKKKIPVYASEGKFGFPLGTEDDINNFENFLNNKSDLILKDRVYFVDIDGVIIKHDSGFHSISEKYQDEQVLIQENLNNLRNNFHQGDQIILVTARPESQRTVLTELFERNNFYFNHLIMGVADGFRYLINDRKNADTYADTAIAINIIRNTEFKLDGKIARHFGQEVNADLSGGSGATTLRIVRHEGDCYIRKLVSSPALNQNAAKVLRIQKDWYTATSTIIEGNVPKVLNYHQSESFDYLDLEDISPSLSLSQILKGTGDFFISESDAIMNLSQLLMNLYDQTKVRVNKDQMFDLNYFIHNKSIPGLEAIYKSLIFAKFNFINSKFLIVNGEKLNNPISTLQKIADGTKTKSVKKSGLYSDFEALIHGDLTAENILVTPKGKIVLIDPLSTYLDSSKLENGTLLKSKTSIAYDFIKIAQSFYSGYENWSNISTGANISEEGTIWYDPNLAKTRHLESFEKLKILYSDFGVDVSEENTDILTACLLFRLIPYRLSVNENSAIYCLALGTSILERYA